MVLLRLFFYFVISLYRKRIIETTKKQIADASYFSVVMFFVIVLSIVINIFLTTQLLKIYDIITERCPDLIVVQEAPCPSESFQEKTIPSTQQDHDQHRS